jgi:glucan biosynthesis protein
MLTTIRGTYSNGKVTLLEAPPTEETMEVLVTFTKVKQAQNVPKQPVFGYSKGIVSYMSPDFDEPLEELKEYM